MIDTTSFEKTFGRKPAPDESGVWHFEIDGVFIRRLVGKWAKIEAMVNEWISAGHKIKLTGSVVQK